jgi:hypothetical protein
METTADKITVLARPISQTASCPCCAQVSRSIHSRYQRFIGRSALGRARCSNQDEGAPIPLWQNQLITARVCGAPRSSGHHRFRKTDGTAGADRASSRSGFGWAPGTELRTAACHPGQQRPLLRVVRRRSAAPTGEPKVVGIDNWAWKRGHRYGTIICDLEQRRIIDILPDREAATVAKWLAEHPSITIIARDRGAGFIQAATQGRPEAVQVGRYQPDPAVQREGRLRPAGRARPPRGQREWPFVRIEELYPLPAIPFLDIFPRTLNAPCVWVQQEPHKMAFRPGSTVSWRTCGARRVARHGW